MKKHPRLAEKLSLLYALRLNPLVNSHADLARQIGVSRQAVSKWVRGTETSVGNQIPSKQIDEISGLFGIHPYWFALNLEDFEDKVKHLLTTQHPRTTKSKQRISVSMLPTTTSSLCGREREIELLNSALESKEIGLVQIFGFGGVGKTSLINSWVNRLIQRKGDQCPRIYAWSFTSQGSNSLYASGDNFIAQAAEWFGASLDQEDSSWQKAVKLGDAIRAHPTVLVLDGLELIQRPPGSRAGEIVNDSIGFLIKELFVPIDGLVITTSRIKIPLRDESATSQSLFLTLSNLSTTDSIDLLRSLGIKGNAEDIHRSVVHYRGHPLSLHLLAGYLNTVHYGNISQSKSLRNLALEKNLCEDAELIVDAYLSWFVSSLETLLIYVVALMGCSISAEKILSVITSMNSAIQGSDDGFSIEDIYYGISKLQSCNLLDQKVEGYSLSVDCHPLVRDFVGNRLSKRDPNLFLRIHSAIFDLLRSGQNRAESEFELAQVKLKCVYHGVMSQRFSESVSIYKYEIKKNYTMLPNGSHSEDLSCIRAFFKGSWEKPAFGDLTEDEHHFLLGSAAANSIALGYVYEALPLGAKCLDWYASVGNWREAIGLAGPYLSMLVVSGNAKEALSLIFSLSSVPIVNTNSHAMAMGTNFLGYISTLNANFVDAESHFTKSEEFLNQNHLDSTVQLPTVSSYFCRFLLETGRPQEAIQRCQKTISWRKHGSWQTALDTPSIVASDLMILGLSYLAMNEFKLSKVYLDQQLHLLDRSNEQLYLPTGLNARSQFFIRTNDFDAAYADLSRALELSRDTGARLEEWEALINLTTLFLKKGDLDAAREHFHQFKQVPDMDFYRHRDAKIAELKRALSNPP